MTTAPFDPWRPIDLHTHSNVSDGTQTPTQLIQQAALEGLGTIALTDHDTTEGWVEASRAARAEGMTLIPGIEMSTQIGPASVHVLGYLIDPEHEGLRAALAAVRESRRTRARRMVDLIGEDYPLNWDHVVEVAEPGATIGRPHIADALVRQHLVTDRTEAFNTILHWRGGYFVPHEAPTPAEAIALVREAGGVPVLAHPGSRGARAITKSAFGPLLDAGLRGLEIGHRENDADARKLLAHLAERHDLIVTGSSDFHGAGKPNRLAEHTTDPAELERILEEGTGSAPIH